MQAITALESRFCSMLSPVPLGDEVAQAADDRSRTVGPLDRPLHGRSDHWPSRHHKNNPGRRIFRLP
jgi:hypothetical protein